MSEHTKGPLTITGPSPGGTTCDDGGDYAIIDQDGLIIGEAVRKVNYGARAPAEANARLWATAPELLRRLRTAREAIEEMPEDFLGTVHKDGDSWPVRDELLHRIGKAIAKAEGREAEVQDG